MKKLIYLIAVLFVSCATIPGFTPYVQELPGTPALDPSVLRGQLPGGEAFFIKRNEKPENRIHLKLLVKAGSLMEREDQRGLAHLLEHLAFNGTKSFPKNDIIHFFESIGMNFGDNLNAFTSFDRTVYLLDIPADNPEILDKALQILAEWAYDITLDPAEVEKEKGVVLEEARNQDNGYGRLRDFNIPRIFLDSLYAQRLPIGLPQVIKNTSAQAVKEFYKAWYKPENLGLVVVGAVDPQGVLDRAKKFFPPKTLGPGPEAPVVRLQAPRNQAWEVFLDKELRSNQASLRTWYSEDTSSWDAYMFTYLQDILITNIFDRRMAKIAEKPGAPFLSAALDVYLRLMPGIRSLTLKADFADGGAEKAVEALGQEIEAFQKYGATEEEVNREVQSLLAMFQTQYDQRNDRKHTAFAEEYANYFFYGEPFVEAQVELDLVKKYLARVNLQDLNTRFTQIWGPGPFQRQVTGIQKEANTIPSSSVLDAAYARGRAQAKAPAAQKTLVLMKEKPAPGKVVEEKTFPSVGVTQWTLSNGAQVYWKKTDFKAKNVVFRAFGFGGLSHADTADLASGTFSSFVIQEMGLGDLTASELSDYLSDKETKLNIGIYTQDTALNGSTTTKNLEELFKLIHLRMAKPRFTPETASASLSKIQAYLDGKKQNPDAQFGDLNAKLFWGNHPRRINETLENIRQFNLEKAFKVYQDNFGSASNFSFVFVGDLDPQGLKSYVETYLASLPAGKKQDWKNWGEKPLQTAQSQVLESGATSQAKIVYQKILLNDFTDAMIPVTGAGSYILEKKLRESIREDLGATYGVGVNLYQEKFPTGHWVLVVELGTDAAKKDAILTQVKKVLEDTLKAPVDSKLLDEFKLSQERWYETGLKENNWWIDRLRNALYFNRPFDKILPLRQAYQEVTPAQVEQVFARMLKAPGTLETVLMPGSAKK